MDWEAIGALGEVIGAVAVILTLVYLAIQIKQNTRMMEDHFRGVDLTAFNAIDESFSRFRSAIASDDKVASLWQMTKKSYSQLEGIDRERADALAWEWFVIYQNMHHRTSQILGKDGSAIKGALKRELQNPGLVEWWKENGDSKLVMFPEFRRLVDEAIEQMDASKATVLDQ